MTTKQLQSMIKWLRSERISYTSLVTNGFEIHGVVDGKLAEDAKPTPAAERPGMYQRYGGELLRQPTAKKSDAVPDEAMVE